MVLDHGSGAHGSYCVRTTESGASELPRKSYSRSHLNPVPVARHEGEPGTQERAAVASELLNCLKGVFTTARVL